MAADFTTEDRFLARRFGFLGLPSERRGSSLSYAGLQAELGDDNAAALVSKIGVLVEAHGLDRLGVPLQNAVDRVLQSLTPDERRIMAKGGTVPRVDQLVSAEVSQAEAQKTLRHRIEERREALALGHYAALGFAGKSGGTVADRGDAHGGKEISSYERQQAEVTAKAYALADQLHLDWAKNNPELLRLGPSAIQALADVHLREDSYRRLTGEVRFAAKDVVTVARYAKQTKQDANELATTIVEGNKTLATGANGQVSVETLNRLRDAETHCMAKPDDLGARKTLTDALNKAAPAEGDQKKVQMRQQLEKKLHLTAQRENSAGARADHLDANAANARETAAKKDANAYAAAVVAEKKEEKVDDATTRGAALLAKRKGANAASAGPRPGGSG